MGIFSEIELCERFEQALLDAKVDSEIMVSSLEILVMYHEDEMKTQERLEYLALREALRKIVALIDEIESFQFFSQKIGSDRW